MPAGLKQTSSIVAISERVLETAANTFTQSQVSLDLSPLDNEVFVVLAIDLNPQFPDAAAGTDTAVQGCVSTTSRTDICRAPAGALQISFGWFRGWRRRILTASPRNASCYS